MKPNHNTKKAPRKSAQQAAGTRQVEVLRYLAKEPNTWRSTREIRSSCRLEWGYDTMYRLNAQGLIGARHTPEGTAYRIEPEGVAHLKQLEAELLKAAKEEEKRKEQEAKDDAALKSNLAKAKAPAKDTPLPQAPGALEAVQGEIAQLKAMLGKIAALVPQPVDGVEAAVAKHEQAKPAPVVPKAASVPKPQPKKPAPKSALKPRKKK